MNKLKFLYDVVKTLRDQEVINGVATVEVQKNQAKIFYFKNEFQKNLVTMETTANIGLLIFSFNEMAQRLFESGKVQMNMKKIAKHSSPIFLMI